MKTSKIFLLTLTLGLSICDSPAQSNPSNIIPSSNVSTQAQTPLPPAEQTITKQESDLTLIKEQNKLIRDFQSAQQATVLWALSGILGFVVILTGFSFFMNFKQYEKDKEQLKSDFDEKMSRRQVEADLRMEEFRRESEKSYNAKYQLLLEKVQSQALETRNVIDQVRLELKSEINKNEETMRTTQQKLQLMEAELLLKEASIREVEILTWELKKVPANILITLCQLLHTDIKTGSSSRIDRTLEYILSTLREKYKEGDSLSRSCSQFLSDSLKLVDTSKAEKVELINSELSKLVVT